jgi:hypothetical protein
MIYVLSAVFVLDLPASSRQGEVDIFQYQIYKFCDFLRNHLSALRMTLKPESRCLRWVDSALMESIEF